MTQSATLDSPVTTRTPPPHLSHRICPCQHGKDRQQTRCGLWCGNGAGRSVSSVPARDMCIVCQDLAVSGVPCPHCGKPANR